VVSIFWTRIGTELAPGKNRALAYPSTRFSTLEAGFNPNPWAGFAARHAQRSPLLCGWPQRGKAERCPIKATPWQLGVNDIRIPSERAFRCRAWRSTGWYSMRSSHYALGKDSAGAAYFLSSLTTAPVAQSSEIRAATEPPPTSASRSGTCRQLVEQTGDSAARWHRNHAEMCSALNY
jgi:hypothetical protein